MVLMQDLIEKVIDPITAPFKWDHYGVGIRRGHLIFALRGYGNVAKGDGIMSGFRRGGLVKKSINPWGMLV